MSTPDQDLLIAAHTSLCIHWGTTAPFAIEKVHGARVGYAQDPCVEVTVHCHSRDVSGLVPIIRQRIYGELAERGWEPDTIEFSPSVQTGRKRKFRDENESSESYGKDKVTETHDFRFLMVSPELIAATFHPHPGQNSWGFGSWRNIPARISC